MHAAAPAPDDVPGAQGEQTPSGDLVELAKRPAVHCWHDCAAMTMDPGAHEKHVLDWDALYLPGSQTTHEVDATATA